MISHAFIPIALLLVSTHLLNMASLTDVTNSTAAAAWEVHRRRPRYLCLHGFRTSGEIMRAQMMAKWPNSLTSRLDLVFADAPFPAEGKSGVEGLFNPPYYEWFPLNEFYTEGRNFEVCVAYIEELMMKHGPFDGLMGFSQGAILSAALPGLQAKGFGLTRVPRVKNVIIISGSKLQSPIWAEVYDAKINCPSLHFIGDLDVFKPHNEALLEAFVDTTIVRHRSSHTIPRLDKKNLEAVLGYVEKIEKILETEGSNSRLRKLCLFPVMCLEHPESRYQIFSLSLAFLKIYEEEDIKDPDTQVVPPII